MSAPAEWLAGEVISLAMCWRLTRADGVVLGFTSHDRELSFEGVRYVSRPGMTPSAVRQSDRLQADSMEIEGVLAAPALTAHDLDTGRWRGARVELFALDWRQPDAGAVCLLRGVMGDVARGVAPGSQGGASYRVELHSGWKVLQERGPLRISPTCRAELGDARCGVDMEARRLDTAVVMQEGPRLALAEPLALPERYVLGWLRYLEGPLCGVDRRIVAADGAWVEVDEAHGATWAQQMRVRLTEGCDKRFATCGARFQNAAAFDGEPHVPGTDALLRYVVP
jgi:uncharacterized phage protein (TIGR02218 family)